MPTEGQGLRHAGSQMQLQRPRRLVVPFLCLVGQPLRKASHTSSSARTLQARPSFLGCSRPSMHWNCKTRGPQHREGEQSIDGASQIEVISPTDSEFGPVLVGSPEVPPCSRATPASTECVPRALRAGVGQSGRPFNSCQNQSYSTRSEA